MILALFFFFFLAFFLFFTVQAVKVEEVSCSDNGHVLLSRG